MYIFFRTLSKAESLRDPAERKNSWMAAWGFSGFDVADMKNQHQYGRSHLERLGESTSYTIQNLYLHLNIMYSLPYQKAKIKCADKPERLQHWWLRRQHESLQELIWCLHLGSCSYEEMWSTLFSTSLSFWASVIKWSAYNRGKSTMIH